MMFDAGSEDLEDGGDAEDDGPAGTELRSAASEAGLPRPTVVRQSVAFADRRAGRGGLRLGGAVAVAAEPRAVAGKPGAHHDLSNVGAVQVAGGNPIASARLYPTQQR